MKQAKYITFKNSLDQDDIVVFSFMTKHSFMSQSLGLGENDILGAGFIHCMPDPRPYSRVDVSYECYGESTSLNIKSRPLLDSNIAQELLVGE